MSLNKYNRIFLLLLTFIFLTAYSLQLNATIRYVSKTGSSEPPFLTWETSADSIQKCINISVFGDTIYVANGVYEEQVVMIDGLSLIGSGMDSCIIDGRSYASSSSRVIQVFDICLMKGFYVIISSTDIGVGIEGIGSTGLIAQNKITQGTNGISLWESNIQAYNNILLNNRFGINAFNSFSIIRRNTSSSNYIGGADIWITAFGPSYAPIIDSNYIEVYRPSRIGIEKYIDSSPTIKNNVIKLKNGGSDGISSKVGGTSKIFNNLIIAEAGYDGISKTASNIQVIDNHLIGAFGDYGIIFGQNDIVKNNIVTNAIRGIGAESTQNVDIGYNNSWNNGINYTGFTPDTTNLSVNPMIVNDDSTQGEQDFHLQMFSPLIDAGDPSILDRDGSRSDIGLYGGPYGESYIYIDLPPRPPVNLTVEVDTLIKFSWNKNTEADFNHYNLYRDTTNNFLIDSTKLVLSLMDTFYSHFIPTGVESLYFKLTGVDNQGNESNPSEEVGVLITSVEDEWKPLNNYILYQNYPNPFNPITKIGYKLKERGYVKLYVYDVKGELISVLVNQTQEAGYYEVEFNSTVSHSGEVRNLASGVYIYQIMITGENSIPIFSDIKKMVYVK